MGGHWVCTQSASGRRFWNLAYLGSVPLDKFLTLSGPHSSICYLKHGCDGWVRWCLSLVSRSQQGLGERS